MSIECEIAHVVVDLEGRKIVDITVPAHTRTPDQLFEMVGDLLLQYVVATQNERAEASLADFAFFLLNTASLEPRVMKEPE
jgi:hypothetical protein